MFVHSCEAQFSVRGKGTRMEGDRQVKKRGRTSNPISWLVGCTHSVRRRTWARTWCGKVFGKGSLLSEGEAVKTCRNRSQGRIGKQHNAGQWTWHGARKKCSWGCLKHPSECPSRKRWGKHMWEIRRLVSLEYGGQKEQGKACKQEGGAL